MSSQRTYQQTLSGGRNPDWYLMDAVPSNESEPLNKAVCASSVFLPSGWKSGALRKLLRTRKKNEHRRVHARERPA